MTVEASQGTAAGADYGIMRHRGLTFIYGIELEYLLRNMGGQDGYHLGHLHQHHVSGSCLKAVNRGFQV
jgi:hypothetical protein